MASSGPASTFSQSDQTASSKAKKSGFSSLADSLRQTGSDSSRQSSSADLNGLLKELEASEKANGTPAAKPTVGVHAYVKFKERMIESVSYREPLRVYNLAHLFGVVEDTMRLLDNESVYYRSLSVFYILINCAEAPTPLEVEKMRITLGITKIDERTIQGLCTAVCTVRSTVGIKRLRECAIGCWQEMQRDSNAKADPPPEEPFKSTAASSFHLPVMSEGERSILDEVQESLGVVVQLNQLVMDGQSFESKPELIRWRNRVVETADFGDEEGPSSRMSPDVNDNISAMGAADLASFLQATHPEADSMFAMLFAVIRSEDPNEKIQGELIDLLGMEQFELVQQILENRQSLKEEIMTNYIREKKLRRLAQEGAELQNNPLMGNVVIQSKAQSQIRKEVRKEQKKMKRELNKIVTGLGDEEKLEIELARKEQMRLRQLELNEARWTNRLAPVSGTNLKLPYVFDGMDTSKLTDVVVGGNKYALPEGTKRRNTHLYEEVYVPPVQRESVKDVQKVKVDTLDPLGQTGFEGFKELNTIQSIVFDQAYRTLENLLICAPTGAGKTNIAMLAVLKTIRDHCNTRGEIDKSAFKIIYIAPMKALAAEQTANFSKRLGKMGLKVRELTGDTQLSKREINETQMLVLTPEKWDVVTRKADDESLTQLVRLLIIDEIHLLHDDRGPVIETIVARTLRQVEMFQQKIRIVGLSATLPNYIDVARFLRVNPEKGLFFFDGRFRPVPLAQSFIGIHPGIDRSQDAQRRNMDESCYEKCLQFLREDHQVLVFVHSRNATGAVAKAFVDKATVANERLLFLPSNVTSAAYLSARKSMNAAKSQELKMLFQYGLGIHHAGLVRPDRTLIERMFRDGHIRVLVCTATLAWGVNLPAHAVIIRGTEIFDPQKGVFTDIGVLDVQQIFGRAGRPQYETSGHGVIITTLAKLPKYVGMLIRQTPIESQFQARIHDNLNAEIARGTVSNLEEAVDWLHDTYFYVRARLNPHVYGIDYSELRRDPELNEFLRDFCYSAAMKLDRNRMVRFDSINGYISSTDLGRIASHFYVNYETIEMLNATEGKIRLTEQTTDDVILALISSATEFTQIKARESEMVDLDFLYSGCALPIRGGGLASTQGKVNCLLQNYISRTMIKNFALVSETFYVSENASRLARAFFEIVLRRGWAQTTIACLNMSKCIQRRVWYNHQSPLRQLMDADLLKEQYVQRVEGSRLDFFQLWDLQPKELGNMFGGDGQKLYDAIRLLPCVEAVAIIKPITATIIQIEATVTPIFYWNDRLLGAGGLQRFWVFIEDLDDNMILHYEPLMLPKKKVVAGEPQKLVFTIPIHDRQIQHQYQLRVASDSYVVDDTIISLSLRNCPLPTSIRPHTDLLPLDPLPLRALNNPKYERLYNFEFFNPVQTQVFFCLYHTDQNTLIGAPTSSGKTLCAELAIFRVLNEKPGKKCVYIAPLKALVRERHTDWRKKFGQELGVKIVEVSGDHTPELAELEAASILITTPEKWDGITRSWDTRGYVQNVELVVIDEIHLLGVERGAVLEAIVTRLKMIARKRELLKMPVRLIGLSTALANAPEVADWIGVKESGLYNFRPNVRPVPIEVHIQGFPGQHYCPRMALMNKPAFKAIKQFSPIKPTLLFVASRRQTRLTAMAFVSMLAMEDDPKQWCHMTPTELQSVVQTLKDDNLKITLPFGIGMHHAGLQHYERSIVERLFVERKIHVLIATATLAWGINVPAHLVIVKGTEYYDGKTHKYVDFPVTDVLQMIGRAGRPQYDDSAVAVVYVQDVKKNFYKRFLYEPFPVESSLLPVLANHVNAEVCAGTIGSRQQVIEYLAGTYLYRRLFINPAYYCLDDLSPQGLTNYLVKVVDDSVGELLQSKCVVVDENEGTMVSSPLGRLASKYYLEHLTIRHFSEQLRPGLSVEELLKVLADTPEYAEIPVRHNEDQINQEMSHFLPVRLTGVNWESPHVKTHLLYQAHFSRLDVHVDYHTDQRSILEACVRILQAMLDFCLVFGWLDTALSVIVLLQQIIQGRWYWDHPLLCLPHLSDHSIEVIGPMFTVPQLQDRYQLVDVKQVQDHKVRKIARDITEKTILDDREAKDVVDALMRWPVLRVTSAHLQQGLQEASIELMAHFYERRMPNLPVKTSSEYKMRVRLELSGPNRANTQAYAPKYPKEKTAGWIVLLGDKASGKVFACQKVPPIHGGKDVRFFFRTPEMPGLYTLTLFVMSDAYLGIDQEYSFQCNVIN